MMAEKSQGVLERIADAARPKLAGSANSTRWLEKLFMPPEVDRAWAAAAGHKDPPAFFERFLTELDVSYECAAAELARIPLTGPVVIVANHPFGMLEGPVLGALLGRVRRDVKFLANLLLATVPELRDVVIPVDPFGDALKANWRPLRQSLQWLRDGGLLVTFPAGEVSSLRLPRLKSQIRSGTKVSQGWCGAPGPP